MGSFAARAALTAHSYLPWPFCLPAWLFACLHIVLLLLVRYSPLSELCWALLRIAGGWSMAGSDVAVQSCWQWSPSFSSWDRE